MSSLESCKGITYSVVEQEGYGVREDFAQQSACQMPCVARSHPLYGVTLRELAENGVYPVTKLTEEGALFGIGVSLLGGIRGQKLHAHTRQLLPGLWRMVVAVCNDQPRSSLGEFREQVELVGVGRSHREASDHSRPANPHMYPKAVEGLLEEDVLAKGGLTAEAGATVGPGEEARRQGHRIADSESGVVRGEAEKFLPEEFLNLPEVGCLAKVVRWTKRSAGKHCA